jgi:hypothetical protein
VGGWDVREIEDSPLEKVTVVGWDVREVEGSPRKKATRKEREYIMFTLH